MYVNIEENNIGTQTCELCKNKTICKYKDYMKLKLDEIKKIQENDVLSPISVRLNCNKFEKEKSGLMQTTYRGVPVDYTGLFERLITE